MDLPFPAIIMKAGDVVAGTSWLADLVANPVTRWSSADTQWVDRPWRCDHQWSGVAEATTGGVTRRFAIAGMPRPDATWIWQFVEESSEARTHRLIAACVDRLPDAVSITTSDLALPGPRFVYTNRAFTALTGWAADEVVGLTPRILQGPRTSRADLDRLTQCLQAGQPFTGGSVNYRKSGEEFWNEWNITAVPTANGENDIPSHYISMMRDATAARVSSHQIRAAATEWATIVDALDVSIVMTRDNGRIVRCNQAFADFVGVAFPALINTDLAAVLFDEPLTLPEAMYRQYPTTIRLDRFDGWFAVEGRPISREGAITAWVHTLVNITPSHQTADQLERLGIAANQALMGIAVLDRDGRIEYANRELARLIGVARESLFHSELSGFALLERAALQRARASGRDVTRREMELEPGASIVAVEVAVDRILDDRQACVGFVVVASDLTERERLWRIAENASNLGNVGSWLGGLRHELGNPVNSVKMALTVLKSHLSEMTATEIARYVDRASTELGRVEYLLKTLKTLSLYESVELERVDLASFLERFVRLLQPDLARGGIELETEHCVPATAILGDSRALHQILVNLVSNAAEASGATAARITLGVTEDHDSVDVFVRDTGTGMSKLQLDKIFQPFLTTKPHGTGLGLVLVNRLVAAMGGQIRVASELGSGTTVTMTFGRAT